MSGDDLDAYAADLLHRTVRPLARIIRAYGPVEFVARWRELPANEQEDAAALLAAGFPVDDSDSDAFGWWAAPPKAMPLHADEYYESPLPLAVQPAAV